MWAEIIVRLWHCNIFVMFLLQYDTLIIFLRMVIFINCTNLLLNFISLHFQETSHVFCILDTVGIFHRVWRSSIEYQIKCKFANDINEVKKGFHNRSFLKRFVIYFCGYFDSTSIICHRCELIKATFSTAAKIAIQLGHFFL